VPPWKKNHLADFSPPHNAIDVVRGHGVGQAGHDPIEGSAPLKVAVDIAFHEDRAALAKPYGLLARQGDARKIVLDSDAEFFGAFLQEAPGAGRTGFVHGKVDYDPLFEADELGVLAADFENGVHSQAKNGTVDERGAGFMGGDLIVHGVGADQLAYELAPGTGCTHPANADLPTQIALDFP